MVQLQKNCTAGLYIVELMKILDIAFEYRTEFVMHIKVNKKKFVQRNSISKYLYVYIFGL